MMLKARITPSKMPQRPASMIFAVIGPITQSMKAEKEPRNAIIELNSGTRIETRIESDVTKTLWITVGLKTALSSTGVRLFGVPVERWSSAVTRGVLMPSCVSIVEFSFVKGTWGNRLDMNGWCNLQGKLWVQTLTCREMWANLECNIFKSNWQGADHEHPQGYLVKNRIVTLRGQ